MSLKYNRWRVDTVSSRNREVDLDEMEKLTRAIRVYNVRGKDIPIVHRVIKRFGGGYVDSGLATASLDLGSELR